MMNAARGAQTSIISKSSFPDPQSGHRHDSGTSSHLVPGGIPSFGRPAASRYIKPQIKHMYVFTRRPSTRCRIRWKVEPGGGRDSLARDRGRCESTVGARHNAERARCAMERTGARAQGSRARRVPSRSRLGGAAVAALECLLQQARQPMKAAIRHQHDLVTLLELGK